MAPCRQRPGACAILTLSRAPVNINPVSLRVNLHLASPYLAVHDEAIVLLRRLPRVPDDYDVLFLQGGRARCRVDSRVRPHELRIRS